jgi:hypothetical protein
MIASAILFNTIAALWTFSCVAMEPPLCFQALFEGLATCRTVSANMIHAMKVTEVRGTTSAFDVWLAGSTVDFTTLRAVNRINGG